MTTPTPDAPTRTPSEGEYVQALRLELEHLWCDLATAYRESRTTPPEKSGGCVNAIGRIHAITQLVGPCPPEKIQMTFLLTGMYEQVHASIGLDAPVPPALLQHAREWVKRAQEHVQRSESL